MRSCPRAGLPARLSLMLLIAIVIALCVAGPTAAQPRVQPDDNQSTVEPGSLNRRIVQLEALYESAERERRRLAKENERLSERLGQNRAFASLSQQVEQQSTLLERLAAKLNLGRGEAGGEMAQGAQGTPLVDENARLRAELDVSNRRLKLLIEQFGEAHALRLEALADVAAARERAAELDARLRQRQLAAEEALMRADKAEKLYAALDEAHARVSTENERLTRDLATARERQAEALQRVVELDSLIAGTESRAVKITASNDAALVALDAGVSADGGYSDTIDSRAANIRAVVYRVRTDDTLSGISGKVYGNSSAWTRIFEANRDLLDTPDDLAPGMSLLIP
ncbi:MAG: LysM peptidoglycan-binding domain-containing protein, partial [Thiohalocapsa sp.]